MVQTQRRDDPDPKDKLDKLQAMMDDGLVTETDYDAKKVMFGKVMSVDEHVSKVMNM